MQNLTKSHIFILASILQSEWSAQSAVWQTATSIELGDTAQWLDITTVIDLWPVLLVSVQKWQIKENKLSKHMLD